MNDGLPIERSVKIIGVKRVAYYYDRDALFVWFDVNRAPEWATVTTLHEGNTLELGLPQDRIST